MCTLLIIIIVIYVISIIIKILWQYKNDFLFNLKNLYDFYNFLYKN